MNPGAMFNSRISICSVAILATVCFSLPIRPIESTNARSLGARQGGFSSPWAVPLDKPGPINVPWRGPRPSQPQLPAEQSPAEQAPAEQPPVEQAPAEEPPAEQPPLEQPPVEQPPVEQPPIDEPAVEEPTVEQPPVEEPPVDEPALEEPAANEPSAIDESVAKGSLEERPMLEPVTEEAPVEGPPPETPPTVEPEIAPEVAGSAAVEESAAMGGGEAAAAAAGESASMAGIETAGGLVAGEAAGVAAAGEAGVVVAEETAAIVGSEVATELGAVAAGGVIAGEMATEGAALALFAGSAALLGPVGMIIGMALGISSGFIMALSDLFHGNQDLSLQEKCAENAAAKHWWQKNHGIQCPTYTPTKKQRKQMRRVIFLHDQDTSEVHDRFTDLFTLHTDSAANHTSDNYNPSVALGLGLIGGHAPARASDRPHGILGGHLHVPLNAESTQHAKGMWLAWDEAAIESADNQKRAPDKARKKLLKKRRKKFEKLYKSFKNGRVIEEKDREAFVELFGLAGDE